MVPLFPAGVPGGPELLVLLLIFGMGIVALLVIAVGTYVFANPEGKPKPTKSNSAS